MPARREVSTRQLELLTEFAEAHRDIALGRFPSGPQSNQLTRQTWESVALQLNAVADGVTKTPDSWRRAQIPSTSQTPPSTSQTPIAEIPISTQSEPLQPITPTPNPEDSEPVMGGGVARRFF